MNDAANRTPIDVPNIELNDNDASVFALFIEDDRYTVPTLSIIAAEDLSKVRAAAEHVLRASPHHLQVEVRRDDKLLFSLRRGEMG